MTRMTPWAQNMEKAVSDLSMRNEVLERRLKLLQHAVETTIEDPVTRSEVRRNLQRSLARSEALAAGREEDDIRPLEEIDGNIKCQFCYCLTNAKLRACCTKGREQDLRISESSKGAKATATAALPEVHSVLRHAVSLMSEPESTLELAEFVVKEMKRAQEGEKDATYKLYVLATKILGSDATEGDPTYTLEDMLAALDRSSPDDLRAKGWMVVCHNDYRQNGTLNMFWSFSKGTTYVCGEGRNDADALNEVRAKVEQLEKGAT